MEILRESAPVIVGLVLPPVLFFLLPRGMRGAARFWGVLIASVVLGAVIAFVMGELGLGLEEALMSIMIDSSLVFTASQVAYQLVWKQFLAARSAAAPAAASKQTR